MVKELFNTKNVLLTQMNQMLYFFAKNKQEKKFVFLGNDEVQCIRFMKT